MINQASNGKDQEITTGATTPFTYHKLVNPKQREFLEAYRRLGTLKAAHKETGVRPETHYKWKDEDGMYCDAYANARIKRNDVLEEVAYERAVDGWMEPVFHNGEVVGAKHRFDNKMLWNLLVNNHPEYAKSLGGNQQNVQVNGEIPQVQIVLPDNGRS